MYRKYKKDAAFFVVYIREAHPTDGRRSRKNDRDGIEVKDPKKPEYGTITLIFVRNSSAPGGWQLTNWVALDAQNNRTTVRLTNQRYGVSVSDSSFTYKDPRRASRRPR